MNHFGAKVFALIAFIGFFGATIPVSQSVKVVRGDGVLSLYNLHTDEFLSVQYRRKRGTYKKSSLRAISRLFRCRHTHKSRPIRRELIELIDQIQDHFDGKTIQIISAYRSPEFNAQLWRQGRKVTKNSPHMYGQAIDIRIPGVSLKQLRDYASLVDKGGVGFYPGRDFVHVDIGAHNRW